MLLVITDDQNIKTREFRDHSGLFVCTMTCLAAIPNMIHKPGNTKKNRIIPVIRHI